ncbi:DUF1983 domain-containing protein [Paracidovorax citrulli]|uniref:Tip attachment protein J central straight fiber domain-containing protein n=2 Tax=Paracidovorax citrulli TaxID=80869 RepID=A1TPR2_PARC0|nr:DUF1983 domain-containing protein [Paracidovorax citrulli]ABM32950.1 hypothetical protein Aave_2375 [Paracidovorax citrulli AAC00-1]ATG93082.1 DUF1983 domain-containing protein [Paracidovorax citrulli]PVY67170.1 uncharacterized protein DUF1983 [Paracidovorax citrulli]REG68667.1 uncharacterized protein DUF1983 [Paracidovorax citrulli]RLJ93222.1 uncharacterized protein DUF1983 [Paracidovorax citrulli]
MTNSRKIDTGVARLPALPRLNAQDKALTDWAKAVTEHLEVRAGSRGNEFERGVTVRELREAMGGVQGLVQILEQDRKPGPGETLIDLGGGLSATVQIDRFAQAIIDSALFRSLAKTLDDPTRFDHLAKEIRDELVRSIADEAAKRGAEVRDLQTIVQTNERSFARQVREVTASLQQASAGIRATQAAWSDGQRAMATNVLQLQASLGRYYRDGTPGRASLEQEMTVLASYSDGLRAQYTLKVQAGGALAGFGIAAEERNGQTTSAFIIMADKFAVVAPNYSGGLLRTPRPQDVVFGVDGNGIYLQNNVYVKGNLRVDGQGRTLADGMRGSVLLSASGSYWSDATARQAVWQALGNGGSAPNNNHLQVGDAVTITDGGAFTQTRHWMGYYWAIPGAVLSGDLLVDGTVAARKVDTRGLTVRDSAGNIILSANGMDAQWLRNLQAAQVGGLGTLARRDAARIGETVTFPDGSVMGTSDFINRLQRITSNNIGVFMDTAAIGTAYIGNAAIGTLQVQGGAVTAMSFGESGSFVVPGGGSSGGAGIYLAMPANSSGVTLSAYAEVNPLGGDASVVVYLRRNGARITHAATSMRGGWTSQIFVVGFDAPWWDGTHFYDIEVVSPNYGPGANQQLTVARTTITATGGKR